MKFIRLPILLTLITTLVTACGPAVAPAETVTLKIAVLPIIDTLPLYVAKQRGFFEEDGVEVLLIPVASAPERVQLMAAGQVDGTINETLAVMQFNKEAVQVQAVRYALR
ncbi:MAG: ABC transporter substrate-binding protein, partial [Anaerolineales bacterium]